ncbi:MAG: tetratricopeptide repeat protein [Candidatus Thermoplasmatota archaeon]|jgi:tetratricopeptide (TPR) repeat protein|nr:tetratricopeptide repeat protein [Candidatus Thermoplasmatota archaeon]MDP7265107.1 tetratricopeptide repeat protein [Candidatus Thermoplasmatota archaeon]
MDLKFCPGCGKTTGKNYTSKEVIDYCGNCGADLGEYKILDRSPQEMTTGITDDNILIRSSVNVTGTESDGSDPVGGIRDSIIQRSVVTTIGTLNVKRDSSCPLCENSLSNYNKLVQCSTCSIRLCESCAKVVQLDRQKRYRGYRLEFPGHICAQCYRVGARERKDRIDRRITAALSAEEEIELMETYTAEERKFIAEGRMHFETGEFAKALEKFDSALSINENNLLAQEGRWTVLIVLEYYGEAVEFLEKILGSRPDLAHVHIILAEALLKSGKKDQAKAVLIRRTRTDGADPLPWLKLGEFYILEGAIQKSVSLCRKAAELDAENRFPEPYIYLASIMLENGDYRNTEMYIERGREIDHDNARLRELTNELKGMQDVCRDQLSENLSNLEEFSAVEGDNKEKIAGVIKEIGDGYRALGETGKADEFYRKYLDIKPGNEGVVAKLETLRRR